MEPHIDARKKHGTRYFLPIAILILLLLVASLFLPNDAHGRGRELSHRVGCASRLKSIGQMMFQYANEFGNEFPDSFATFLLREDCTSDLFVCPSSEDMHTPEAVIRSMMQGGRLSYVYLGAGFKQPVAPDAVLAYERLSNHVEGMNVLFGDGHVDFIPLDQANKLITEIQLFGHNPPRAEMIK
ncbi:MAG TPA: H-X9-DG-CTERM domain-containing protein [Tepidisphaeraceae bacterium]|nr:H-X9-DG-CTERM domain-containing protein [Tepidisphaeraceae bacterium]